AISCGDPLVKAAFLELADAWPQALPFSELRTRAHQRVQSGILEDPAVVTREAQELGQFLLQCYTNRFTTLLELSPRPLPLAREAGARPRTWPLARWQASRGPTVTTLRHGSVTLGEFERQLVRHMDGQRDRVALIQILAELVHAGKLTVRKDGEVVKDPAVVDQFLREVLDRQLRQLVRSELVLDGETRSAS